MKFESTNCQFYITCLKILPIFFKSIACTKFSSHYFLNNLILTILRFSMLHGAPALSYKFSPLFLIIRMRHRERFLKIFRHVCCLSTCQGRVRLNRVAIAFFVAPYCASRSHQARTLNGNVYLKAYETTRLSLYVITCRDVCERERPADSSDSGIWFLHIPRVASHFSRRGRFSGDRQLIFLQIS